MQQYDGTHQIDTWLLKPIAAMGPMPYNMVRLLLTRTVGTVFYSNVASLSAEIYYWWVERALDQTDEASD